MRKEESSNRYKQNNKSYDVSYDVFCARNDKLPYNTYMVENIVVFFLLTNDCRRKFLAFLGNVDARFLDLQCGDFECVDPAY